VRGGHSAATSRQRHLPGCQADRWTPSPAWEPAPEPLPRPPQLSGSPAGCPATYFPVSRATGPRPARRRRRDAVSFWPSLPPSSNQRAYPPWTTALGRLLRQLHSLPPAPIRLPSWQPLRSLGLALEAALAWLAPAEAQFLTDHRDRLLRAVDEVEPVLPTGLIHGDAARSNLLWDHDRVILGDWDGVCQGPREQDLVLKPSERLLRPGPLPSAPPSPPPPGHERPTTGPATASLRTSTSCTPLTSFLRLASTDPEARAQLDPAHRLSTARRSPHPLDAVLLSGGIGIIRWISVPAHQGSSEIHPGFDHIDDHPSEGLHPFYRFPHGQLPC
jgi:hypothetical protein